MKTKRLTELALLSTIALTIFMIEQKIPNPLPIPGVKLGLANIVTVYALYRYRPKEVFLLVTTRVILGAVFGGNLMALLYSAAGSLLCLGGMISLHRLIPERILWASSVLGAVLHNIGQIAVAVLVMRSAGMLMYFPFLLVSGCCAGAFTGLCAQATPPEPIYGRQSLFEIRPLALILHDKSQNRGVLTCYFLIGT